MPLNVGDLAPNFNLSDSNGVTYTLSEQYASQNVLLVFNIGFA